MKLLIKPNYLVIPGIAVLMMTLGRLITSYGMPWYRTINLPFFTPSGFVIGLVWQIIYILTTTAVLLVWNRCQRNVRFWTIISLFTINAALNVYWSYLFFYQHTIFFALIDAIFLEITVLALLFLLWPLSHLIALLLAPYVCWVAFAIVLNAVIWFIN